MGTRLDKTGNGYAVIRFFFKTKKSRGQEFGLAAPGQVVGILKTL